MIGNNTGIKKDCFAYNASKCSCDALLALYCTSEKCKFYKPRKTKDAEKYGDKRAM